MFIREINRNSHKDASLSFFKKSLIPSIKKGGFLKVGEGAK